MSKTKTNDKKADKVKNAKKANIDFETKIKELETRLDALESNNVTLEVREAGKVEKITLSDEKLLKTFSDVKVRLSKKKTQVSLAAKHILNHSVKDGKVTIVTIDGQKITRDAV